MDGTAERDRATQALERMFAPRSVAVVGVPRGMKTGRLFLEALLRPGFRGDVYPVNPHAGEILGLRAYPSVQSIGRPVDLAVIVTPPDAAADVIADCGRAGVPGAALFTAGFDELGSDEGRERGARLLATAREAGVRLVGPNCMGLYVPALNLGPFPEMPAEPGDVAFVSQSGSLLSFFAREAAQRGFGISKAVSIGNQLDLQAADYLRYLGNDDATRVIALYLEGARDGRALYEALRTAAARTPVVLWKSGRTAGGARAARSHTGSLAGSREIWSAMARQSGALLAGTMEELADLVVALRMRPRPLGDRIAVVTGPGGPSISASDALEEAGLRLAVLQPGTVERLRAEISAVGTSPRNPVDVGLIMYGPTDVYARATAIVGSDPGVDAVIVIGGRSGGDGAQRFADLVASAGREIEKPLAVIGQAVERPVLERYRESGIGLFPTAERAVAAFASLARWTSAG